MAGWVRFAEYGLASQIRPHWWAKTGPQTIYCPPLFSVKYPQAIYWLYPCRLANETSIKGVPVSADVKDLLSKKSLCPLQMRNRPTTDGRVCKTTEEGGEITLHSQKPLC